MKRTERSARWSISRGTGWNTTDRTSCWPELGKSYNGLIIAWPDILKQSRVGFDELLEMVGIEGLVDDLVEMLFHLLDSS